MTDDIVAFIRARLDEDEQVARAATPGPWEFEGDDPTDDEVYSVHDGEHGDLIGKTVAYTRGMSYQQPNTVHIALHDPARVLRGVEAKRRRLLDVLWFAGSVSEVHDENGILIAGGGDAVNGALSLLASEWSTHPDYRQEWQA